MNPAVEKNLSEEIVSAKSRVYRFSVVIEKDKDGYSAFTPELQGCYSQGDTHEEAIENIRDAIVLHVEDRLNCPSSETQAYIYFREPPLIKGCNR